jgi:hypothetical protein
MSSASFTQGKTTLNNSKTTAEQDGGGDGIPPPHR